MENDLLTIKEFAEFAGVSVQSIYKRLSKPDNPIQRYLTTVERVKYIQRKAYYVLYNPEAAPAAEDKEPQPVEQEQPQEKQEQPKPKNSTDRILDILERQLEEQRRQLQEKDNQIAAQNEQIKSLLERLEDSTRIINQQQQLTAMNTKALLGTDKTADEPAAPVEVEQEPPKQQEQTPPPQKRSFWQRLFGGE